METIDENSVVLNLDDDDAVITDRMVYVIFFIFQFCCFFAFVCFFFFAFFLFFFCNDGKTQINHKGNTSAPSKNGNKSTNKQIAELSSLSKTGNNNGNGNKMNGSNLNLNFKNKINGNGKILKKQK